MCGVSAGMHTMVVALSMLLLWWKYHLAYRAGFVLLIKSSPIIVVALIKVRGYVNVRA